MPEHIRALIVVLVLSAMIFVYIQGSAGGVIGIRKYMFRRNLWIAITLIAFLAHNFWVYAILSWIAVTMSSRADAAKVSLFFFLLFAVPQGSHNIPGLGLVNYLFELNHQRLMVIGLLPPTFLKLFLLEGKRKSKLRSLPILCVVGRP